MLELTFREYLPTDEDFAKQQGPLWQKCTNILPTRDAWKYVRPMLDLAKKLGGYGLSANQVGLDIPLFVTTIRKELIPCYRPRVICFDQTRGFLSGHERCLSFPNVALPISRPYKVQVDFVAYPNGKRRTMWLENLDAIGFQHEYDHLDGVTIFNRYKQQLQAKLADRAKQAEKPEPEFPAVPLIYDPTKD